MDLVSICRGPLAYFRIKELKDVLTQLGISKQGRKQDLMDRILGLISDEEVSSASGPAKKKVIGKEVVAKLIGDAYRKMQIADAPDLATKRQTSLDIFYVHQRVEAEDFSYSAVKKCCPCGTSLRTDDMVQEFWLVCSKLVDQDIPMLTVISCSSQAFLHGLQILAPQAC